MLKIAVLIPAYNVRSKLSGLLDDLLMRNSTATIVVVDDGSEDGTGEVVSGKDGKIVLLQHQRNRGKGAALKTGIDYIAKQLRVDAIAFMDGDGQHSPQMLQALLDAFGNERATFVIGKRSLKLRFMPLPRVLSNRITSFLISLKIGQRVGDSQSGFRLIDFQLLQSIWPIRADGYNFESELLIKAGKAGAKIKEVAVSTIYADEISNIRPLRDIVRFLRTYFTT